MPTDASHVATPKYLIDQFRSLSFSSRRCLDRCWNIASTGSSTIPLVRYKSPVLSTSFRRKTASNTVPIIDCWANDFCCIGFLFLVLIHEFCSLDVSCFRFDCVYFCFVDHHSGRTNSRAIVILDLVLFHSVCVRVSSNRFLVQKILSECVRDESNRIDRVALSVCSVIWIGFSFDFSVQQNTFRHMQIYSDITESLFINLVSTPFIRTRQKSATHKKEENINVDPSIYNNDPISSSLVDRVELRAVNRRSLLRPILSHRLDGLGVSYLGTSETFSRS